METQPKSNQQYVIAVAIMAVVAMIGVVIISVIKPDTDNTVVITAIFSFLTPTTLSLLAFMKSQETHVSVNSRLDGFVNSEKAAAKAEGIIEGANEANTRTDDLANK